MEGKRRESWRAIQIYSGEAKRGIQAEIADTLATRRAGLDTERGEEEFMAAVETIPRPLMRPALESESRCGIAARYEDDNLRRRLGSR